MQKGMILVSYLSFLIYEWEQFSDIWAYTGRIDDW